MFDHLDDPHAATATTGWRRAVQRRVQRRRRRRAGALAGALATVTGLVAAVGLAADRRLQPERVEVEGLAQDPVPAGGAVTVLFVGVDQGFDPALADGEASRSRYADTIVVARIDPGRGQVRLLPVPRDLWVPITGTGSRQRIATAFASGGAARLVDTLRVQLGIPVDHYVQADFDGAADIVDALGGLRLAVPHRVTSEATGLDMEPGCQVREGAEVVALGRSGDVRVHDPAGDEGGRIDPSEDSGRQDRTAVIATALLAAVGDVGPSDLPALVEAGFQDLVVDDGIERHQLLDLGRTVGRADVVRHRLPVYADRVGEVEVLRLAPGTQAWTAAYLDGRPPPAPVPGAGDSTPPLVTARDATGLVAC